MSGSVSVLSRAIGRASVLARPGALVAAGVVLAVCALHLWVDPTNPPGFHRDEASLAYSAYAISESLRDERGAWVPLYFESFGDYKSPVFVYALAAVFSITGPSAEVARVLGAVGVLAAVLLLGLLGLRRTGSLAAAVGVTALAGSTPWLFELGRVAVEVTLEPLVFVAVLLAVERASRLQAWTLRGGALVGALLALLAYTYAGARLLAPLLALALGVFATRSRARWLLAAWATFGCAVLPLALYTVRHPGALTARYHHTTFVEEGMSELQVVRGFLGNYGRDVGLWSYVTGGDPKPHIHLSGTGMLLAALVLLAAAGAVLAIRDLRRDRWHAFVLAGALLVPVPAAVTQDRLNGYRLALLPVVLVVLAIPAVGELAAAARRNRLALGLAGALAALALVQFGHFISVYREKGGPARQELYEAGVPQLLERAFAEGGDVYMDFDEPRAHAHARWYAVTHDLPPERAVILADGGVPPDGSVVFGRFQACDFTCTEFERRDTYWLARAETG